MNEAQEAWSCLPEFTQAFQYLYDAHHVHQNIHSFMIAG